MKFSSFYGKRYGWDKIFIGQFVKKYEVIKPHQTIWCRTLMTFLASAGPVRSINQKESFYPIDSIEYQGINLN